MHYHSTTTTAKCSALLSIFSSANFSLLMALVESPKKQSYAVQSATAVWI